MVRVRRKMYVRAGADPSSGTFRMRKHRQMKKTGQNLHTPAEVGLPSAVLNLQPATSTLHEPSTSSMEEVNSCGAEPSSLNLTIEPAITIMENPNGQLVTQQLENLHCPEVDPTIANGGCPEIPSGEALEPECNSTANVTNSEERNNYREKLPPLCSHTECTPDDVMLMCLSVGFRHNLPWVAVEDIMKMFNSIYGTKKINATKYSLMNRFFKDKDHSNEVAFHYYCPKCAAYVAKMENASQEVVCACGTLLSDAKTATYFATISLKQQLKDLFEKNEELAVSAMTYRFTRVKINKDNLEDIYDGTDYKAHAKDGQILSSPQNFSLSFFTDGVGKSKKSFWPIYVTVNELPPKDRKNNILIVGLYHGDGAPNQRMFLKPFVDEANELSSNGYNWMHKGENVHSKVIPLLCIADSDARYKVLNMQSHKAFHGCTFCYITQTQTLQRLKYTIPDKRIDDRSPESHHQDIVKAYENRHKGLKDRHGRGVLGVSSLSYLKFFNISRGLPVDYMHNLLLGVMKTYFENLFLEAFKKFWVGGDSTTKEDIQKCIDERLLKIKPPTCITRTPRSMSDWGNWKANEWRTFMLFYAIPCLTGLLQEQQLQHLALLIVGSAILLQKSVSIPDALCVHRLFQEFIIKYQLYFGREFMYYNVHLLIHVVPGVLRWGPLFTHNAFMYESYNSTLLQLKKNPFRVVKEVSKKYLMMQALPHLLDSYASSEDTLFYCEDLFDRHLVRFKNCDSSLLLGAGTILYDLTDYEFRLLSTQFPSQIKVFYKRMICRGKRITTFQYTDNKKNNDSVISTKSGEILEVRAIFVLTDETVRLLTRQVLIQNCSILAYPYFQHFYDVTGYGDLKVIQPGSISGQCIFVETVTGTFLSIMPYGCYGD